MTQQLGWRLYASTICGFLVVLGAFLAGVGGAGWIYVAAFAAIFTIRGMLTSDPADTLKPTAFSIGVALNILLAWAMIALGKWLADAVPFAQNNGIAIGLAMSIAASVVSVYVWSWRRDAEVKAKLRNYLANAERARPEQSDGSNQ